MDITGRKLFVKALQEEGVTTLFGYPGGTVTDLFDELYKQDGIEVVLPRHEQGLIHEAEGYARSTGKVGVCLVTSGPGATNIMTGLADAHYDSIPLVCFTGQVPLSLIGNDAFQEVDIVGMTRSITKYGVTVRKREDLGRIIKMAFTLPPRGSPDRCSSISRRTSRWRQDLQSILPACRSVVTNRMRACMWDS